jgi:glycosyltransferase involved in cell wall biosynthesis
LYLGKKIAVIVPAFNEERLLPSTLRSVPAFVDVVVVVDDASADATSAAAMNAGERVVLVRHTHNRGVGAALATGYAEAVRLGAEVIAVMAGDAQMDSHDLPALLAPIARGEADYTKGNRFAHASVLRVMPFWRLCGGFILSWLTRVTSGYWSLHDSQCGYTAISRDAVRALPLERLYPRYGYPNDLLAWLNTLGCRVQEVPVRPVYGDESSGIDPVTIVPRLLFVLARSFMLRLWHKHLSRALGVLGAKPPTLRVKLVLRALAPQGSDLRAERALGKLPGPRP